MEWFCLWISEPNRLSFHGNYCKGSQCWPLLGIWRLTRLRRIGFQTSGFCAWRTTTRLLRTWLALPFIHWNTQIRKTQFFQKIAHTNLWKTPVLASFGWVIQSWSSPSNLKLSGPVFEHSEILLNNTEYWELLKGWLGPVSTLPAKWSLCYRATDHGWSSSTFHSQCNSLGPSVTFIRVGEYIFGGYTDQNWRK